MAISNRIFFLSLSTLCLVTIGIYFPGLNGNFHFDDYPNIVNNLRLHLDSLHPMAMWDSAWSGVSGLFKRPLSILSFSLNTYFTGLNPGPMKLTNLVIHISCGIGITILTRLIIQNWFSKDEKAKINLISLLVGAMWLTHPLQLTSVLYIVQRMTSLASLFSILAIISYCILRQKMLQKKSRWFYFIPILILVILSTLSKEIGVLIPLYLFCIELFAYRFKCFSKQDVKNLYGFYFFIVALPALFFFSYLLYQPERFLNYSIRDFTLTERLLTEPRIITEYLRAIIIPNIFDLGLIKEEVDISKSLFNPSSTLLSIIFLLSLIFVSILTYQRHPYIGFGISWFLAGHALESTIFPLELRFEHRNYLPSFGILIALVLLIVKLSSSNNKLRYIYFLMILWVSALSTVTFMRASQWKNEYTLALFDVERHPNSSRANMIMGSVFQSVYNHTEDIKAKNELYREGIIYYENAEILQPNTITPTLAINIFSCVHNKEIPKHELEIIKYKTKTTKLTAEPVNALTLFTKLIMHNKCIITTNDYLDIMYIALSNSTLKGKNKAQVLAMMSGYFRSVLNDIETAINLMREASIESPSRIIYKLELANLLAINNDYDNALNEVNNLQKINKYGRYTHSINKTRKFIVNHKNNVSKGISH